MIRLGCDSLDWEELLLTVDMVSDWLIPHNFCTLLSLCTTKNMTISKRGDLLKCTYSQNILSINVFKPKKELQCFAIKSCFKFPALAMPNEVDRNESLVTNDVTSGTSQASCFYFACLTTA